MVGRQLKKEAITTLNESPSEKEGKFVVIYLSHLMHSPSMKVPPKRKGNLQPAPPRPS